MRGPGRITQLGGTPPPVISAIAAASATLTLTTTIESIAGCTLSLGAGTWLVWGTFAFRGDNQGSYAIGYLYVNDVEQAAQAQWRPSASAAAAGMPCQLYRLTLTATTTLKLRANKNANVGTFTAQATYTNILALRTQE